MYKNVEKVYVSERKLYVDSKSDTIMIFTLSCLRYRLETYTVSPGRVFASVRSESVKCKKKYLKKRSQLAARVNILLTKSSQFSISKNHSVCHMVYADEFNTSLEKFLSALI